MVIKVPADPFHLPDVFAFLLCSKGVPALLSHLGAVLRDVSFSIVDGRVSRFELNPRIGLQPVFCSVQERIRRSHWFASIYV